MRRRHCSWRVIIPDMCIRANLRWRNDREFVPSPSWPDYVIESYSEPYRRLHWRLSLHSKRLLHALQTQPDIRWALFKSDGLILSEFINFFAYDIISNKHWKLLTNWLIDRSLRFSITLNGVNAKVFYHSLVVFLFVQLQRFIFFYYNGKTCIQDLDILLCFAHLL